MPMCRVAWIVLVLASTLASSAGARQPAIGPESRQTAFVLDTGARTVTALDVATAGTLGQVTLEGEPAGLLRLAAAGRLVVLDRGPGKETARFGYHPTGRSTATVVDASSMTSLARLELGWGLSAAVAAPDGRHLIALCPGYRSQKARETLPSELVVVDLDTLAISGRVALDRPPEKLMLTGDGRTAVVFSLQETVKKAAPIPAQLAFIDLAGPTLVSTLVLERAPVAATLSPDGRYVYVLDMGRPPKKKDPGLHGRLDVVSLAGRTAEATFDVGPQPRGLVVDEAGGTTFILSDGPAGTDLNEPTGELRVIRGSELVTTLVVAPNPSFIRVSPDRESLHVVGTTALTTIDYPALRVAGRMPLETTGRASSSGRGALIGLGDKRAVSELVISPDGTRGFALYDQSSKLLVLDLGRHTLVASLATGRGGVKAAKLLGAWAATMASAYVGQSLAVAAGSPTYSFAIFSPAPASATVALGPDGRFAYVLNTHTNDVTIVRSETGEVVDKIAAGGRRLERMGGGALIAVVGSSLHLIDTATQKALPEAAPGLKVIDLVPSPDGRVAIALAEKAVLVLDSDTGKLLARSSGFKRPVQVVFGHGPDGTGSAGPSAPPPASGTTARGR